MSLKIIPITLADIGINLRIKKDQYLAHWLINRQLDVLKMPNIIPLADMRGLLIEKVEYIYLLCWLTLGEVYVLNESNNKTYYTS